MRRCGPRLCALRAIPLLLSLNEIPSAHSAAPFQLVSVDSGAQSDLHDIAYGKNAYIAVGRQSVVSTNGTHWQPLNYSGWLDGVVYAQDKFVVVGQDILTSSNGVDWQTVPPVGAGFSTVAYTRGTFVAAGGDKLFSSTNGIDWVRRSLSPGFWITCLAGGPSGFMAAGMVFEGLGQLRSAGFAFSADGVNWNGGGPSQILIGPLSLAWGNNLFIGVGQDRGAISSSDGGLWSSVSSSLFNSWAIEFINGRFVVMRRDGDIFFLKSTNSWDWVYAGTNQLNAATHDGKDYYFVGNNGVILKSDGPSALAALAIKPGPTNTVSLLITGNPGVTYNIQLTGFFPYLGDTPYTVTLQTTTTNILFPMIGGDVPAAFFRLREQ